jgi:predicted phage terminase large subunit-like protein
VNLNLQDQQLIAERLIARFTQEQMDAAGLLDRPFDADLRKSLAEIDFQFFCRFYLAHHFYRPLAEMHVEVMRDLETLVDSDDVTSLAVAMPRGAGKTTIASNAFVLWCILFRKRQYILIIQDSSDQAVVQLSTIKDEITDNPRIAEDFGILAGDVWAKERIVTRNRVMVEALGATSRVRGRKYGNVRPDLIIMDDMEDLEAVSSETQREKTRNYVDRSIIPAGDPHRTRYLGVGNYLHYDCWLMHITHSPMWKARIYRAIPKKDGRFCFAERQDLWDTWREMFLERTNPDAGREARAFYEAHEEEMLRGTEVAYPDLYDYYFLMAKWADVGSAAFFSEYLNEPQNPDEKFFRYETYKQEVRLVGDKYETYLVPWDPRRNQESGKTPWPLSACTLYAATDPSMGVSDKGDPSAIILAAVAPDNRAFVLEAQIKHRTPYQIIDAQNDLLRQYPVAVWGIETVQFQAFFANEAAESSMKEGLFGHFTPISTTANKVLRINSLQPDLENAYILIAEHGQDELRKQLDEYPNGSKVDGVDALEMVRTLMRANAEPQNASTVVVTTHHFAENERVNEVERVVTGKWLRLSEEETPEKQAEDPFPFMFG